MDETEQYTLTEKQEDVYKDVREQTSDGSAVHESEIGDRTTLKGLAKAKLIHRKWIDGEPYVSMYPITEKTDVEYKSTDEGDSDSGGTDEQKPLSKKFFSQFKGIGDSRSETIMEDARDKGVETLDDLRNIDLTDLKYISEKRSKMIRKEIEDNDRQTLQEAASSLQAIAGD